MDGDEKARVSPDGRILCPCCGGRMNRHAEKIDRCADPARADADLDGVVAEFHTCPACKYVLERAARP